MCIVYSEALVQNMHGEVSTACRMEDSSFSLQCSGGQDI